MEYKHIVVKQNFQEKDESDHSYTLDFAERNVHWSIEAACTAIDDAIAADLEALNANSEGKKYCRKGDSVVGPDGSEVCRYTIQCLVFDPVEAINAILDKRCQGAKWAAKVEKLTEGGAEKYKWTGRKPKKDFGIYESPIDALRGAIEYLDNLIN